MAELPRIKKDPQLDAGLCKCRPICKNRRRIWHGVLQKPSKELELERKPPPPCFRRWPSKIYPNAPCPLLTRVKGVTVNEYQKVPHRPVVRVCVAPLDDTVDLTYLRYKQLAKQIGAWQSVKHSQCSHPFCDCGKCCACRREDYQLHDAEGESRRCADMRSFDKRVKNCPKMRIMYQ